MKRIRIGTRGSALALQQARLVEHELREADPALQIELVVISTAGDDRPEARVDQLEGIGWFTSALERALLEKRIDVAVHSYKDLPVEAQPRLRIVAAPRRGPVEDVLCSAAGARQAMLPRGARVGSSSLRRFAQLRRLRPDLGFLPLRGNVPTRIERVRQGKLDAVILARAGLERLGLTDLVSQVFPASQFLPAPGQGALAIQARREDRETIALVAGLDHAPTHRAVRAERALLRALRGGCSVPVGAYARVDRGRLSLEAAVFSLTSDEALRVRVEGADPEAVAALAAKRLLRQGARRLLDQESPAALAAVSG